MNTDKTVDLLEGQKADRVDVSLQPEELDLMDNVLPTKYEEEREEEKQRSQKEDSAIWLLRVLLELMSGRKDKDGNLIRESIGSLGGGGCFEPLRSFIDPSLNEDYPLAEAVFLDVLVKDCVEDDPMKRPSIDDIMKALARMV